MAKGGEGITKHVAHQARESRREREREREKPWLAARLKVLG